ncbi:hypothetical protein [Flexivirga oryzae]|uniref:DUF4913 domain-containing protein n=1 Tax=Flexivirga oryzae TaxID=1794944 RepID=A0A839NA89_9MICO|nr:hypothetical protein [Flexivirga oryzae]
MNTDAAREPLVASMVRPFPEGGSMVRLAYRELSIAANGDKDQVKALGPLHMLPRPWDPPTCRRPELREQLWEWLEEVVSWLNREYTWDVAGAIPPCWPQHPHLMHEIAVLADQRRRAGLAFDSNAMEEWHRYALPAFADRMRNRLKDHCEDGHQGWPGRGRYARFTSDQTVHERQETYAADVRTTALGRKIEHKVEQESRPRLASVNLDTGELGDVPDGPQPE